MADPEILFERHGTTGLVTLNRPHALNAITPGMVRALAGALDEWEGDSGVERVVLEGAGGRAFSAGGDIRLLAEAGRSGGLGCALAFWREEYRLNIRIKTYPKPYISLIDGIVMGGGVGLSLHGSHRIAGPLYRFAMPEVGIGFFPDVGATYALPRLPGRTGLYLALTGARVEAVDALGLGLATHLASSERLAGIRRGLLSGEDLDGLLPTGDAAEKGPILRRRAVIDRCFAGESVADILARLDADGSTFAAEAAATIRTKSPTSLCIAFEQMRRGGELSFAEAMRMEMRIVSRVAQGHDFYEGVRAALIDRDHSPHWCPASLAEVDAADIAAHFERIGEDEL
jgi:enoyl-CoA hydratase